MNRRLSETRFKNSQLLVEKLLSLGCSPMNIAAKAEVSVQQFYQVLRKKNAFSFAVLEKLQTYYEAELKRALSLAEIEKKLGDRQ
jgi:predicted DNA-binding protein YlxM (UPF0122 family)